MGSLKIWFIIGAGGHRKLIDRRELPKKRGAWTVCRFEGEGAWLKRGGVIPPMHTELGNNFYCDFTLLMPMSSLLISN